MATEVTCYEPSKEENLKFQRVQSMKLDVHSFKPGSIYTSKKQMDEAVKNKTFDLNKTMALKNGRLFFLCYD